MTEPNSPNSPGTNSRNLKREIKDAIQDTIVLLEYLGQSPDSRLQAQFADTNDDSAIKRSSIKPPCKKYSTFIQFLSTIWSEYEHNDKKIKNEKITLDDVENDKYAFLFWSRDFLASLAGPATADTIEFTRQYSIQRFLPKEQVKDPDDDVVRNARELATSVKHLFNRSYAVLAVTVLLSAYALSGQKIISSRDAAILAMKEIDEKIATIQMHGRMAPVNHVILDYIKTLNEKYPKSLLPRNR